MRYTVVNVNRSDAVLGDRIERAGTFWQRFKGLMGRPALAKGEGLHIDPCNGIHMFFMKIPLDVVFIDDHGVVIRAIKHIKPWRATRNYAKATSVIELPVGVLDATGTEPGDRLEFRAGAP